MGLSAVAKSKGLVLPENEQEILSAHQLKVIDNENQSFSRI